MNLALLIQEAQRLGGRVDSQWNDRTRRWLNEALTQWAISVPWPTLQRTETFVTDGTSKLVLPQRVLTVQWAGDRSNKRPLDPSGQFDREFPDAYFGGTTGAAYKWREVGFQCVTRQPAAASQIQVQTATSDVFGVYAAGLAENTAASGTADQYYPVEEKIDVSSSGPHSSVNSYVRLDILGKDDYTPADVVITAGATPIARISAHDLQSEYRVIEFVLVPTAGTQIDIGYIQKPAPLIEDYQTPPPSIDREYLIWYAASMIHHAQGQKEDAQQKRAHAEDVLQKRIYKEKMHGDRDLRAFPHPDYWNHDDQYTVPENF